MLPSQFYCLGRINRPTTETDYVGLKPISVSQLLGHSDWFRVEHMT